MPFVLNKLFFSVNPVKTYKCVAAGKPVIAISYAEAQKFGEIIEVFISTEDFQKLLK